MLLATITHNVKIINTDVWKDTGSFIKCTFFHFPLDGSLQDPQEVKMKSKVLILTKKLPQIPAAEKHNNHSLVIINVLVLPPSKDVTVC